MKLGSTTSKQKTSVCYEYETDGNSMASHMYDLEVEEEDVRSSTNGCSPVDVLQQQVSLFYEEQALICNPQQFIRKDGLLLIELPDNKLKELVGDRDNVALDSTNIPRKRNSCSQKLHMMKYNSSLFESNKGKNCDDKSVNDSLGSKMSKSDRQDDGRGFKVDGNGQQPKEKTTKNNAKSKDSSKGTTIMQRFLSLLKIKRRTSRNKPKSSKRESKWTKYLTSDSEWSGNTRSIHSASMSTWEEASTNGAKQCLVEIGHFVI